MIPEETTRWPADRTLNAITDLARTTTTIDDPAELHPLISGLRASLQTLVQITDQLAHAHMHHRGRARSAEGDVALGGREADDATWALVRARELLNAAEGALGVAAQSSGQVVWNSTDGMDRWVGVVHLQGADAQRVLDILEQAGAATAMRDLARWDLGDETTEAALINGYVYEGIPTCQSDQVAEDLTSGYVLLHNRALGYVSLLRQFPRDLGSGDLDSPTCASPASHLLTPPTWSPRRSERAGAVRTLAL